MKKTKLFIYLISCILFLYLGSIVFFYLFQPFFIYHPEKLESSFEFNFQLDYEELVLSQDQESVNALYFSHHEKQQKLILYFHGNADNLQRWASYAFYFDSLGYDSFFIDYNGFGKSSGSPNEKNLYKTGQLAYDWISKYYSSDSIIIYGRSIGSAIASKVASENPGKMLILETPFYSMLDVARKRYPFMYFPFEPYQAFPTHEYLHKTSMSIHIFHGTNDRITPLRSALKLKAKLKEGDSFTIIQNGKHKNLSNFADYNKHLHKLLSNGKEK